MSGSYVSSGDDPIITPFSDDDSESVRDEDLITDDAPAGLSPAERVTREEKKGKRIKALLDSGKASKEENERLRAELASTNTRLARLEGAVSVQQRPQQPGVDPFRARMDVARKRQNEAYLAAQAEINNKTFDDKRADHWAKVAADIEDEKMSIQAERILAQRMPEIRTEQAQQVYVQKYPEVYNHPRAFSYAQGRFQQRRALGDAETSELVEEIMTETMTQFKLGAKKAPTASERDRYVGRAASGNNGGGGNGAAPTGAIQMTKELRKMAVARYRGERNAKGQPMTEDEAIRKWADTEGKALRQKKVL